MRKHQSTNFDLSLLSRWKIVVVPTTLPSMVLFVHNPE
ncbi:unnamed protein product [Tenebrio molitor]|nr:unnamed protein product [Tenebrio molitor]